MRWGFIGTGSIANEMANEFIKNDKEIYGVTSLHFDHVLNFKEKYNVKNAYKNVDDLLADKNVEAVYIAVPHNLHKDIILKALNSNKHCLVEKAITLNSKELKECLDLAKKRHLILMEAMTIYHMPLYKKLFDYIGNGKLGKVNLINAFFGSYKEYTMDNRFFNKDLAGGALLDIGVYVLSLIRLFLNEKPYEIKSIMNYSPSNIDESSLIILKNKSNQLATASISLHSKQPKRVMISCEFGYIEIMNYPRAEQAKITYLDGNSEEISLGKSENALYYEIIDFENAINNKEVAKIEYTKDVIELMTKLRKQWNFYYKEEIK